MIKTNRLTIRKLGFADCRDYYEIFGNPNISRYDDFDPIREGESRANIERIIDHYNKNASELEFAVEYREEQKVIGVLALLIEDGTVYIGFHFNEAYHGRGLATEAVIAFLPWLHKTYHLPIKAVTDPANQSSIRVLGKLGFHLEEKIVRRAGSSVIRELRFALARPVAAVARARTARRLKRFA